MLLDSVSVPYSYHTEAPAIAYSRQPGPRQPMATVQHRTSTSRPQSTAIAPSHNITRPTRPAASSPQSLSHSQSRSAAKPLPQLNAAQRPVQRLPAPHVEVLISSQPPPRAVLSQQGAPSQHSSRSVEVPVKTELKQDGVSQFQARLPQHDVAVVIPSRDPGSVPRPSKQSVQIDNFQQDRQVQRPSQIVPKEQASAQDSLRTSHTDIRVVVPRAPTDAERNAYKSYPEADRFAPISVSETSKPQKAMDPVHTQQLTSAGYEQREKANTTLAKVQDLIADILQAEDQLQPDTSGVQSNKAARFFQVDHGADIERPILQPQAQYQLDSALQKVINNGRFADIDVDDLGRVIKLCENAIVAASAASYQIDDDITRELDEWTKMIVLGEQGLFACRSLLRIMTAGREEKQLYSEDALRNLLNLVSHVVETCIIPIVEMRSDAGVTFRVASSHQKSLLKLLSQSSRVLRLLGELLFKTDVDESTITTAEYICKTLVFVENATSEKDAALGIQKFETIRLAAMDVLAKIFARYTEQRQFIFDEILTSLEKLPVSRQSARQFKMVDGKPIQLVSALLMRLVQTSATRTQTKESRSLGDPNEEQDESEGFEDHADGEFENESDSAIVKRSKQQQKRQKKGNYDTQGDLQSLVSPLYDAALKDSYYMINYLLQRAMTSTKTGDQPYRNLLDIFTEDFLSVLGSTDWPAAELLLRALLTRLLEISNSNKSSAPSKSMALETMGSMATRITAIRLQAQQASKHSQSDESEVASRLTDLHEAILADELIETDLLAFDGPYRAVLQYLQLRSIDDPQLQTARGYHIMQWAKQLQLLETPATNAQELRNRLTDVIKDFHLLENE